MHKRRKRRPNWPYRLTWLALLCGLVLYLVGQTWWTASNFGYRSYGKDWGLALIASCLDVTVAVWFVAVGASIGSFLNVVAYRLPLGRYVGGHSGCPYCQTAIDGLDNVPVLAWVKLRGRCRACRLPISIQYPLVELTVALVFLAVYISEFSRGAGNLPGTVGGGSTGGLMRVNVNAELVTRIVVYLLTLSGLIAAALIAVKKKTVPLTLYLWTLLPLVCSCLFWPDLIIVRWRDAPPVGPLEARLDVITTLLCGAVAGMAVARIVAPLVYRGFDRSLMTSDLASSGARQFIVAMAVAGASVGWQAVVPMAWIVLICAVLMALVLRPSRAGWMHGVGASVRQLNTGDLTIWVWLGLLVFRANWTGWTSLQWFPSAVPEVGRHVLAAILLAPVAVLFSRLSTVADDETPEVADSQVDMDSELDDWDDEPRELES